MLQSNHFGQVSIPLRKKSGCVCKGGGGGGSDERQRKGLGFCSLYSLFFFRPFSVPRYNFAVDIWSLAVVAYIMLCGQPPFPLAGMSSKGPSWSWHLLHRFKKPVARRSLELFLPCPEVTEKMYQRPSFDGRVWSDVSTAAKGFIKDCLQVRLAGGRKAKGRNSVALSCLVSHPDPASAPD